MGYEAPTPERVKELRIAAGLSLAEAAEMFDYPLRTWQRREDGGKTSTPLRSGEFQLLMLLASQHPKFSLISK